LLKVGRPGFDSWPNRPKYFKSWYLQHGCRKGDREGPWLPWFS